MKVSDFGLARVADNYQLKVEDPSKRAMRLPYRWMSVEAIKDLLFTKESDVVRQWIMGWIHDWSNTGSTVGFWRDTVGNYDEGGSAVCCDVHKGNGQRTDEGIPFGASVRLPAKRVSLECEKMIEWSLRIGTISCFGAGSKNRTKDPRSPS